MDLGCGPGEATVDLASIVGPTGKVLALDRSARFLDALNQKRRDCDLRHVVAYKRDLDAADLSDFTVDGVWARWIFGFVKDPQRLLQQVCCRVRPGGTIAIHEYFQYNSWHLLPESKEFESFVANVMKSWRDSGGQPDVGRSLPGWLEDNGFTIQHIAPLIDVLGPADFAWQWPKTFVESGTNRLTELRYISAAEAEGIKAAFGRAERAGSRMTTPAVLEVVAVRAS